MEFFENKQEPEKAVLVSVDTGDFDAQVSIDELEFLADTAGAKVLAKIVQKKEKPDAATYLGSGRLLELKEFCRANDVDLIIFDCELSPSQQRNVENFTDVRVVDRTTLILDIFAARARSSEGKLQVELAQLKYSLPRLGGKGLALSRLGGGIGTRGPGESKLESDRRHIRRRIDALQEQLKEVEKRRNNLRNRRAKDGIISVAIVGYTNAGKSTLMNALTDAGVLAQDKLFATLDPTARSLTLPDGRKVMLIDTVGLIRRLPHNLVEAFKSTLEEAANADVILNVCDCSSPECAEHLEVTRKLLKELGCETKPVISVMNKSDLTDDTLGMATIGQTVFISALNKEGLDELLEKITACLEPTRAEVEFLFPFDKGSLAAQVRKDGVVKAEEYRAEGLYMRAIVDTDFIDVNKEFII
ncbi:MAG: GTPase HflX [Clostridiales bacterium]|nr:GTPase HflX [Clostridiales bacterium]